MAKKVVYTNQTFQEYFKEIRRISLTGDYTEGTFRAPFETFIKSLNKEFNLIQEPRRTQKLGAPDFKAFRKTLKIGYIESKDLNKNLDNELESEQIQKYSESINNLVLTNYSRFILIRNNQKIFDFNLFNLSDLRDSKFAISDDKIRKFLELIETFFDYKPAPIRSAKELSNLLSKKAKLLKDLAKEQLEEDLLKVKKNEKPSLIYDFYEGIKELIKEINIDDCADAYAQTITYGLFLSKMNCPSVLGRNNAVSYIPQNIGVIKRIFINISGEYLPSNVLWIVEEIIDVLNVSDLKSILAEIDFRGKKDRDPFTFFYEDFLSLYDPKKRKHLGIYYTPRPVVNFIVNSIEQILKKDFGKSNGFAEDDVNVLDPAVGTGTFLWLVNIRTLIQLKNKGLSGLIKKKIENHILKDFYGLEILITPYIISHLKLTMDLKKWYYEFKANDRIQVYLTNTLDPSEIQSLMPFMSEITEESRFANQIKVSKPILVVLGNPPYSVSSSNKSKWIMKKIQDYKKNLSERNIQPLDDDYIKFIRFAQWKIDQNRQGVLGFITNNSYLNGIIHRQMRKSLLDTFDRIYILNLHGDSRKKEKSPDGTKDENVFDIQQGVAIALFVKNSKFKDKKVFYADLYGTREYKYKELDRNNVNSIGWQELKPQEPYYFFVPKDFTFQNEYEKFWNIADIFKERASGVKTHRDQLVVGFTKDEIIQKLNVFTGDLSNDFVRNKLKLKDTRTWKLKNARTAIMGKENLENSIKQILYRPFDTRWIFYDDSLVERSREEVMRNMFVDNLSICFMRQVSLEENYTHFLVSERMVDNRTFLSSKGIIQQAPLYLYSDSERKPNINPKLFKTLYEKYKKEPTPEEILYYVYAVVFSKFYRTKYAEFLEIDFPRVPFTQDFNKFKKLSEIGKELVNLHLMKTELKTSIKFDVQGSNVVKFIKYKENKVYLNKDQFFDGVTEDVWNFYIGGYQVLDKWLKSRKNRELSTGEIEHFIQVVEIIKRTIECMKEIDKIGVFG